MLNRKPLALYLAALFVFCVSGCSKRDNDSSGDSGDSAIVECISLDNFSDKAFGEYAISRWDLDGDKCISQSEASKITEIPKQAFKNNNIIESIDDLNLFPSITTLREEAFAGCIKIKTANLKYIQIVEQYTFSGTTYLPNVETVLSHAFEGTSLESVSLPKATYVGECAFVGVSTLKTLDLPNVETVDSMAFGRTALESVSLPKATYVGDGAFYSVSTLKTLDLPMATNIGAEIVVVYNDYSDKYELLLDTLYLTSPLPISMSSSSHDIEGYHNTNLYLNINKKSEVSGVSWNGIEWKSITFVE